MGFVLKTCWLWDHCLLQTHTFLKISEMACRNTLQIAGVGPKYIEDSYPYLNGTVSRVVGLALTMNTNTGHFGGWTCSWSPLYTHVVGVPYLGVADDRNPRLIVLVSHLSDPLQRNQRLITSFTAARQPRGKDLLCNTRLPPLHVFNPILRFLSDRGWRSTGHDLDFL